MANYSVSVDPTEFTARIRTGDSNLVDAQTNDTITFTTSRSESVVVTVQDPFLFGGLTSFTMQKGDGVMLTIIGGSTEARTFTIEAPPQGTEEGLMTGTIKVGGNKEEHPRPRPHHK
jgi:hypothetical protein